MLDRFRHIVDGIRGPVEGPALLAVSGGVDSMCLVDLWLRVFGADTCALAHCNFNLRGKESDADEAFVSEWAESHGVRLHKTSFNTEDYAFRNGLSIEMAARELRYRWFGDLCGEYGYCAVVTAHHSNDNAETLILNLVRGTGLRGLSGMSPVSQLPYGTGKLLRPLLTFTRKQIEGYAFVWKVPHREDSTNASVEYRRNSVRHEIFPVFEKMNPSYVRTLNREMTYFSDASEIVEEWCNARKKEVCISESVISIPRLMALSGWRYLLYHILEPYGFNSSVLESLENLLTSGRTVSGKRFESADHVLVTGRDILTVLPDEDRAPLSDGRKLLMPLLDSCDSIVKVSGPGVYSFNGSRIRVEVLQWTDGMSLKQPSGTLIMDASRLCFPFVCRMWRQGDWFIPMGMRGKKLLSDLFTDLKYGHKEKKAALVLVDCTGDLAEKQHVAGVAGVRIDDRYKVTSATQTIIRITLLS